MIYVADGNFGNGAGDFDFQFLDATGASVEETYIVNVSPPGIPNFLFAAKETDRVEITFDRNMADPSGKHLEFEVQDNGISVTSTSCNLKIGDPTTIVVYTSPELDIDNTITVSYTKGTVLAESGGALESFDFQLAGKIAQVINFDALADKTYGDPDFSLLATASSGLSVGYNSTNATVVSVSGTTVSVNNAGAALINAFQEGDEIYAKVNYQRVQIVNKASATITISDISQEYTGSGIAVTTTTNPGALTTKVVYDGSLTLPIEIGTYVVSAEIENDNYEGVETASLIISDNTAPDPDVASLPNIVEECTATVVAPTTTDACAGIITGTTSDALTYSTQGIHTITWNFNDGNGNDIDVTQDVVIEDLTAPVADVASLFTVNEECSATLVAPTATDNCDAGSITATTTTVFPVTVSETVTWTYTDATGNVSTQDQEVVILDITPPVLLCQDDFTVIVPESQTYTAEFGELDLVSSDDNCGIETIINDYNLTNTLDGAIFSIGTTTVEWSVIDTQGNLKTCSFDVIVDSDVNVKELTNGNILKVYPNPNTGTFILDYQSDMIGEINVKVVDVTGRSIYSETFNKVSNSFEKGIDLEKYSTGVYYVIINTNNVTLQKQIIISDN